MEEPRHRQANVHEEQDQHDLGDIDITAPPALGKTERIVFGRHCKDDANHDCGSECQSYGYEREEPDAHGAKLDLVIDFGAEHKTESDDARDSHCWNTIAKGSRPVWF